MNLPERIICVASLVSLIGASSAFAQVSLTTINSSSPEYTAFTGTGFAGTSATLPSAWVLLDNDFAPGGVYAGTSGTGSWYTWSANSNNHLGAQRSGTNTWSASVSFTNNTGLTISALSLSLDYSQIRYANAIGFIVTGTGALAASDFSGLSYTGTTSGTNGTVVFSSDSISLNSLSVAPGSSFGFTWTVTNPSGADGAVGLGNVSLNLTAIPEPSAYALVVGGLMMASVGFRRHRTT